MKYLTLAFALLVITNITIANVNPCEQEYQNSYDNNNWFEYEACLIKTSQKVISVISNVEEEYKVTCKPSGRDIQIILQYFIKYNCTGQQLVKLRFKATVYNDSVTLKNYSIKVKQL